ncbi:NupC/NupG family nucleoside CNT transporter [Pantoea sp. Ap-967]|uniref:NupC/NupG family nucleoside CNT transporter n=1 Tax=Pantoea sp. Ap-967 TaxID=2608362 RepID=UPI00141E4966|nr:NupC/NupG family nucleoside CNT transporter [Pantoea sp. Ap-967]NIE77513.1 NupC/NupG family nucleoside CNT transporter [Pantoea sp. Ap-967]
MGLIGIVVLLLVAVALSSNRKAIRLRTVVTAFAVQAGLGAFALYVPWGQSALGGISASVASLQDYANQGIDFIFGGLSSTRMAEVFGSGGFVFAIRVLPVIVFFSSFIAVLYYLGIMRVVIQVIGGTLQRLLGTSRTEAMAATANIFVGQTEAPMVIRPYVARLTRSELFAVMVGGMASVAGSVLIGYASLGVELKYLIAASFMAAPGGLLMAKLMEPETEQPHEQAHEAPGHGQGQPANVIDAAAIGASAGLHLALNVGAMLLTFIGLIALLNGLLGWTGSWFGLPQLNLQLILGHGLAPLAFVLGVPWHEAITAGGLIGEKLVLNEFVAYADFARHLDPAQAAAKGVPVLSAQAQAIVTFALCGFANLASIGIQLGSLGIMAPERRADIARLGLKAVVAGTLSNLMSAALAGVFLAL